MTRKTILLVSTLSVLVFGCSRNSQDRNIAITPSASGNQITHGNTIHSTMRMTGANYSQSISLDTANRMIGSYLSSVNYPSMDTALRSLTFDADTLRAYLNDSRIVTIKFVIAHQNTFVNGTGNYGKYIGMKPGALTVIIAGLDNNSALIRNSSNGVYEHAIPCPNLCPVETDAYLH